MEKYLLATPLFEDDKDFTSKINIDLDVFIKNLRHRFTDGITWSYFYDFAWIVKHEFKSCSTPGSVLGIEKPKTNCKAVRIPLRIPGMTLGHITLDRTMTIVDFVIYEDAMNEFTDEFNFEEFKEKYMGCRFYYALDHTVVIGIHNNEYILVGLDPNTPGEIWRGSKKEVTVESGITKYVFYGDKRKCIIRVKSCNNIIEDMTIYDDNTEAGIGLRWRGRECKIKFIGG